MGLFDGDCTSDGIEALIESIDWIGVAKNGKEEVK
jgi:hypothetical protein